jgi:hypothetical protein
MALDELGFALPQCKSATESSHYPDESFGLSGLAGSEKESAARAELWDCGGFANENAPPGREDACFP